VPTPFEIKTGENTINNVQFIGEGDDFNTIFYFADNASTLYKAKFSADNGKIDSIYNLPISNPPFKNIKNIVWSPKKDAALLVKDDGVYFFDFQKYNFVSQEEVLYGRDVGDIAWSPDDSKIAYYYAPTGGEHSLIFADKTNTEMQRMLNFKDLGIEDPYLSWSPDSEWLIIIPRNKDRSANKIYLYNAYKRELATVNEGGGNLEAIFSPDNSKILYSTYAASNDSPVTAVLSVMDKSGENKQSLSVYGHVGKSAWLKGSSEKVAIATYNKETGSEAIFEYDLASKQLMGFDLPLSKGVMVKEILSFAQSNLLFYIANNQFYVANIK
jgi:Tol biopolymer transport system component